MERREAALLIHSLSRDDEKRRLGEDFLGHAHESKTVPPRTPEIPRESGRTLGRSIYPIEKHRQTVGSTLQKPANRAEIPEEIGQI